MKVEVIHYRDSDSACDVAVFVDGEPVDHREVSFDPGAGFTREDWNEIRQEFEGLSPAARAVAEHWFDMASESKYITD
ncbi:MAG: hypothetical protein J2P28_25875 [Actinobacteria bacterium]|nr:hypothetical protein [Actinomycetota bacterium]